MTTLLPPNVRRGRVPPESEKQFQAVVVDLARRLGWHVFHAYDSRRSEPGWPDLFMVKGSRAIAAELKREKGALTPAQMEWLGVLEQAGIPVYVWRPSQKQEILSVLQAGARGWGVGAP